uniref:Reverse transcriptase domain-containing protein n=1 Tax=Populus alba TaxID=43335 RepID=A0A4U5PLT5_POPAL|nr:hypothetical protein D5086_0000206780 [Populus alba]
MHVEDRIGGDTRWPRYQDDFSSCICQLELLQIPYTCLRYLWHNGHHGSNTIQKKLDWIFAQSAERNLASHYMKLCQDEESYYKQRCRVQWLQLGDKNTAFFYNSLLHRQSRNRIHRLTNEEGATITNPQEIRKTAVSYYERLLTTMPNALPKDITSIYPNTISDATKLTTSLPVTNEEIKSALFSIPDNKSPGPDGYNALFFKQSWNIIGTDFIAAVKYFFSHNLLPRCVNATRVALVPKIENPTSDGISTSLWYDYWLSEGKRLIDILLLRILTSTGLSWTTKVSDIICRGQWHFPVGQPTLQVIWHSINFQPCQSLADCCIWKGHTTGKFFIASAWELIHDTRPTNSMHHLL